MNNFRTEQADGVRKCGEVETGVQLLGDRGAADEVSSLEDQRLEPSLGEIGGVYQTVVATTDHNGVVVAGSAHLVPTIGDAVLRSGRKNGVSTTCAGKY